MYEKDAFNINAWHFDFRYLLNTFSYLCGLLFKSCSPTFLHLLGIKDWKNSVSGECTESWRCCAYKITVLYFSPSVSQRIKPHYKRIKPSAQQIRANIFSRRRKKKKKYLRWAEAWKWFLGPLLSPHEYFSHQFFLSFFFGKCKWSLSPPSNMDFQGFQLMHEMFIATSSD